MQTRTIECPLCDRRFDDRGAWRCHLLGRHRKSEVVTDLAGRMEAATVERDEEARERDEVLA